MEPVRKHHECGGVHEIDTQITMLREHYSGASPEEREVVDHLAEHLIHDFDETMGYLQAVKSKELQVGAIVTLGHLVDCIHQLPRLRLPRSG